MCNLNWEFCKLFDCKNSLTIVPFFNEWMNNLWVTDIFLDSCSLFIIVRFTCLLNKNIIIYRIIHMKALIMMKQQCLCGKGDKKDRTTLYNTIIAFLLHLSLKETKTIAPQS